MDSLFRHYEQTLTTQLQAAGVKSKVRWYGAEFKQLVYARWDGLPTVFSIGSSFAEASAWVEQYLTNFKEYQKRFAKLEHEGRVSA